jgi:hypothetical protein
VDLDAPQNSDTSDSGYPGAGLVAHLLWGSGPSKARAIRTMNYAKSVVERLEKEEERHGSHDQSSHGAWAGSTDYKNVMEEQKAYKDGLSAETKNSMNSYVDRSFINVNENLRSGASLSAEDAKVQSDLDAAIAKAPPFKQDVFVSRGIDGEAKEVLFANAKTGDIISDKGFMSTTTEQATKKNFVTDTGAELRIKAPKGTRGLTMDTAETKFSEGEILFPRDTKLKVVSVSQGRVPRITVEVV